MTKIDITTLAADLAAHRAEAEGYLRRAGIHQIDTRTTVRVLDDEGWKALDQWIDDLFARAVEAARKWAASRREAWLEARRLRPLLVSGEEGDIRAELRGDDDHLQLGETCEFTGLPWRFPTSAEVEVMAPTGEAGWQEVYSCLTFEEGWHTPPTVRDRREHPAGRWQSDLWRVTVNPSPAEWYPRVDERDLALPGEFALSWRAPHQTAPMWGVGEPLGRVFESEEGHITVFLRVDALEVLGISLEEVVAYAVTATGNY